MDKHNTGAAVVVGNTSDPLLEGIVTDRDIRCRATQLGGNFDHIVVGDVMTPVPITCGPDETLENCLTLMEENHVRRIPVVNERCRCVGIVTLADLARHASPAQFARTLRALAEPVTAIPFKRYQEGYFYCGQTHEMDQILLLRRRRELGPKIEVLT
jgi:signal-transduction protein with cAMP-binding, CBS, and nucleotidyltransferase domain